LRHDGSFKQLAMGLRVAVWSALSGLD
jgi:hypothetical protein